MLLASRLCGATGRIYAFEPDVDVQNLLKLHIDINHADSIEIVPKAVAAENGVAQFYPAALETNRGVGSLLPAEEHRDDIRSQEPVEVEKVCLNDFCMERGITHVDVMKIDVEGYDLEALRGAEEVLRNNAGIVVMVELEDENLNQFGISGQDVIHYMDLFELTPLILKRSGKLVPLPDQKTFQALNVFFLNPSQQGKRDSG